MAGGGELCSPDVLRTGAAAVTGGGAPRAPARTERSYGVYVAFQVPLPPNVLPE